MDFVCYDKKQIMIMKLVQVVFDDCVRMGQTCDPIKFINTIY